MTVFSRVWSLACALAVTASFTFVDAPAHAEAPSTRATPVHVIGIDSDDAEEQADALTGALRSRVRLAPGWSLQETSHSLSMLTAALRCPQRPDTACLQRIGDQIHADRFVWGTMAKSSGNQVTADLHLWARGKPDTTAKESYSDNLKDQNDENLRRIATRLFERLSGTLSGGSVSVHAGDTSGIVLVNGQRKASLEHGAAAIDLPSGLYTIEVRAPGFVPTKQQVAVLAGVDVPINVRLVAERDAEATTPTTSSGAPSSPVRTIAGWSAVGVGAGLLVVAGIEAARFVGLKSDLNDDRAHIDKSVVDVCAEDQATKPFAVDACSKFHDAQTARTVGLLMGGLGVAAAVTGVVLLVTDHPPADEVRATTAQRAPARSSRAIARATIVPSFAPTYSGFDVRVSF